MMHAMKNKFADASPLETLETRGVSKQESEPHSYFVSFLDVVNVKDLSDKFENLESDYDQLVRSANNAVEQLNSNIATYPDIHEMSKRYVAAVKCDLGDVCFVSLRRVGEQLADAVRETKTDIYSGYLPRLEAVQEEALNSLLDLHHLFLHELEQDRAAIELAQPAEQLNKFREGSHETKAKQRPKPARKPKLPFDGMLVLKNMFVVCCVGAFMAYAASHVIRNDVTLMSVAWATAALAALEGTKRSAAFKAITGPIANSMDGAARATIKDIGKALKRAFQPISRSSKSVQRRK